MFGDHRYRLYGLSVASRIELPELVPESFDGPPDVQIEIGLSILAFSKNDFVSIERIAFNVDGVASFEMLGGSAVYVDPVAGTDMDEVRLFLLGSAFAALLHQRGLLPLHSNVIEIGGQAIGFLGHSGAGKSTLAAWFHDRGYRVLSDDVCVVAPGLDGGPLVFPGVPRLRLWQDALEATGHSADRARRISSATDKFVIRTSARGESEPAELGRLYVIREESGGSPDAPAVSRLSGAQAVQALIENTYRGNYVGSLGKARQNMDQCVAIARRVPLFALSRPWDLARLDDVGRSLICHVSAGAA